MLQVGTATTIRYYDSNTLSEQIERLRQSGILATAKTRSAPMLNESINGVPVTITKLNGYWQAEWKQNGEIYNHLVSEKGEDAIARLKQAVAEQIGSSETVSEVS